MDGPSFDPGGFYEFDLARGAVFARGGARVLVLSNDVVAPLIAVAAQNGDLTAVRRLGKQLGEQATASLGARPPEVTPELVLGHAAAVLGLFGWGKLGFEQWGSALVVSLDGLPELDDAHLAVSALLGGVLSAMGGREVACVPIGTTERFVVVDPSVAEEVWSWAKSGTEVSEIVARLAPESGP